ncbi:MAG TPA: histidine kinase [Pilimelia sp.]|nr:histidine kinase [Pilimelia sp.]
MDRRFVTLAPAAVAGVSAALAIATLGLAARNGADFATFLDENRANTWLVGLCAGLVAVPVLRRRPGNRLGPVFAVAGVSALLSTAAAEYATYRLRGGSGPSALVNWAAWCGTVLWAPTFLLLMVAVPLLFPDGRLASPRWRWPARLALAAGAVGLLAAATAETIVDDEFPAAVNPIDLPLPDGPQMAVANVAFFACIAVGLAAIVGLAVRMRRLPEPRRQQHAWVVTGVVLALVVTFVPLPAAVTFAGNALAIVAFGVGIVRHQLFDIEVVLSRALVYALLTAGALAAYLVTAAVLGVGLSGGPGLLPAVVASVAALLLAGGRQRLQRAVDRLLYGERGDPLRALTALGVQLDRALDSEAVLPAVVTTVRETLRLPYAAVQLSGEPAPVCAAGDPPARTVEFPLAHAGERVGVLIVGLRRGESGLDPADDRLLTAFARQVSVAAHGVRVTRDLRRSRERLVVAREEERRRLRRELHDGLGPALAGITLGLETAGRAASRDGSSDLPALLGNLRAETAACLDEVRQISADLRPPSLDQIGLVPALRQHADLLSSRSGGDLVVHVTQAGPVPALPAAAEAAAYRIALEAMTNTARHAGAHRCDVHVELDGDLQVTVRDDGTGVPGAVPGVGLASMRERAEELGGSCVVTFREGVGTCVAAVLPVASP